MRKLKCEWTPDCQGNWDYDAELVTLSCRYWPRRGMPVYTKGPEVQVYGPSPSVRPSAKASIRLQGREFMWKEFEAETEHEVKRQVEEWAQTHCEWIVDRIMRTVRPQEA